MTGPLPIGADAPDFEAVTTEGRIRFHEWLGSAWGVLFSHPKDYTPVCTTELGMVARLKPEFDRRGVKVMGLSIDPIESHHGWAKDIEETQGTALNFPMVADFDLKVSKLYGMLPADAEGTSEGRTPANNATVRTVFIIGPDKKVRIAMTYPMSVGRNFAEIIRALDAVQETDGVPLATPANWVPGQDVIVALSLDDTAAEEKYGKLDKKLPYLRFAKDPKHG